MSPSWRGASGSRSRRPAGSPTGRWPPPRWAALQSRMHAYHVSTMLTRVVAASGPMQATAAVLQRSPARMLHGSWASDRKQSPLVGGERRAPMARATLTFCPDAAPVGRVAAGGMYESVVPAGHGADNCHACCLQALLPQGRRPADLNPTRLPLESRASSKGWPEAARM